jgi:hypothetical protein
MTNINCKTWDGETGTDKFKKALISPLKFNDKDNRENIERVFKLDSAAVRVQFYKW